MQHKKEEVRYIKFCFFFRSMLLPNLKFICLHVHKMCFAADIKLRATFIDAKIISHGPKKLQNCN